MGPIWGRQDPGAPHVGPMNLAICENAHWTHWCNPTTVVVQPWRIWTEQIIKMLRTMNQCWLIVNWTRRNKLQRNPKRNIKFVICENGEMRNGGHFIQGVVNTGVHWRVSSKPIPRWRLRSHWSVHRHFVEWKHLNSCMNSAVYYFCLVDCDLTSKQTRA